MNQETWALAYKDCDEKIANCDLFMGHMAAKLATVASMGDGGQVGRQRQSGSATMRASATQRWSTLAMLTTAKLGIRLIKMLTTLDPMRLTPL